MYIHHRDCIRRAAVVSFRVIILAFLLNMQYKKIIECDEKSTDHNSKYMFLTFTTIFDIRNDWPFHVAEAGWKMGRLRGIGRHKALFYSQRQIFLWLLTRISFH